MDPTEFAETVRRHCKMPSMPFRIARSLQEANLPKIRNGIIFVFAVWSGPAVVALQRFTKVLSEIEHKNLEKVVLDIDGVTADEGRDLFGSLLGGGGEAVCISDGNIVDRLMVFCEDEISLKNRIQRLVDNASR